MSKVSIVIPCYNEAATIETLIDAVLAAPVSDREVIVVCRSGHRSLIACKSLEILGFNNVASLKTGLRGWNDFDLPLIDIEGQDVDPDHADEVFTARLRDDQVDPARR